MPNPNPNAQSDSVNVVTVREIPASKSEFSTHFPFKKSTISVSEIQERSD